uniref:Uncharacterized protein n=1 Tax=Caenorhabditis japonica TaxID=281687 RepID=A0A2Q4RBB8_CAEJA
MRRPKFSVQTSNYLAVLMKWNKGMPLYYSFYGMSDDSDDESVIVDSEQQQPQPEVNIDKSKKAGRPFSFC